MTKKESSALILIIFLTVFIFISLIISLETREKEEIQSYLKGGQKEPQVSGTESVEESNSEWLKNQKKLYQLSREEIDVVLKEIRERFPEKGERLEVLSLLRLDTPYQLGCLGEESGRDNDPIFRLDVTDCTAFVLTNVALLYSKNLEEAREIMELLNYEPGKNITFENRLHFTSDRNAASPYFEDVTQELAGRDKIATKEMALNKINPETGKRLIDINWEKEIILKYIPSEYLNPEFLSRLPNALGIGFIRKGDEKIGLDAAHEGFLFNGDTLIHASSLQGKVVKVNFFDYYFDENKKPRFEGVILFTSLESPVLGARYKTPSFLTE